MTTAQTCTTPEEAWMLVSHFIGNRLMAVGLNIEYRKEDMEKGDLENAEDLKQDNVRLHKDLVENLTAIARRMDECGHREDAEKIRQILAAAVAIDLDKGDTVKKVTDLHEELNPGRKAFREALAKFHEQNKE